MQKLYSWEPLENIELKDNFIDNVWLLKERKNYIYADNGVFSLSPIKTISHTLCFNTILVGDLRKLDKVLQFKTVQISDFEDMDFVHWSI